MTTKERISGESADMSIRTRISKFGGAREQEKIVTLRLRICSLQKKNEEKGTTSEETNCGDHVEARFFKIM